MIVGQDTYSISMTSKRETTPPSRAPAHKLSLSNTKGRQHSTGSISIRFNPASLVDDDEDIIMPSGMAKEAVSFEVGRRSDSSRGTSPSPKPAELMSSDAKVNRKGGDRCKSAPVSEVTTPVSNPNSKNGSPSSSVVDRGFVKPQQEVTTAKEEGEHSFLSGIRGRLQDPLSSLLDKVEELTPESGIAKAIDRKWKVRPNAFDSNEKSSQKTDTQSVNDPKNLTIIPQTVPILSRARPTILEQDIKGTTGPESLENEVFSEDQYESASVPANDSLWDRTESFEIVDDFFPADQVDSMAPVSGLSVDGQTIVKSSSSDQILPMSKDWSQKPAKARQKLKKSKTKAEEERPISVSMSEILSNKSKDMEDALIEEQFFDMEERQNDMAAGTDTTVGHNGCIEGSDSSSLTACIPMQRVIATIVAFVAYLITPMPSFLSGLILGAALAAIVNSVYQWINVPPHQHEPFVLPDLASLPPLQVPVMKESKNEDGKFKGWMNELGHYDPDNYHINQTQSVYIQLEGTSLRLQTPKQSVPKRAMFNEPSSFPTSFVHQRHIELQGSSVFLLPPGLVRKRLWSKKYPICIALAHGAASSPIEKIPPSETPEDENQPVISDGSGARGTESALLFLFGRTGREKEEWYRRFQAAARGTPLPTKMLDLVHKLKARAPSHNSNNGSLPGTSDMNPSTMRHKRQGSGDSNTSEVEILTKEENPVDVLAEYMKFMARIMPARTAVRVRSSREIHCEPVVLWTNAALFRGFWDFLREDYWAEKVRDKIQKKLSKIHVPYFIDELTVTGINLGGQVPVIRRVSSPYLDDRGLWVDADINYDGGFQMSLETKVNLMKLKKPRGPQEHKKCDSKQSAVTNEDEEDSAESSTDDEGVEEIVEATDDSKPTTQQQQQPGTTGGNTSKKFLRIVDKITQSRYFQQATEYKYIKKAMEGVSNTRLMLNVELQRLSGTLAVNIPPPPTDRLWYGFRTNPYLRLSAKPKVGSREVSVSHITDWIEKKLTVEFQRVFVMPNMDDIPVPVLCDKEEHHCASAGDSAAVI